MSSIVLGCGLHGNGLHRIGDDFGGDRGVRGKIEVQPLSGDAGVVCRLPYHIRHGLQDLGSDHGNLLVHVRQCASTAHMRSDLVLRITEAESLLDDLVDHLLVGVEQDARDDLVVLPPVLLLLQQAETAEQ